MTHRRALAFQLLAGILAAMVMLGGAATPALAVTPTPTPTPGPVYNQANSFNVDPNAAIPWPIPATPILPTVVTPAPTVFNATPAHATNYPDQAGTATAQVGAFTGPIGSISTPVAEMVGMGPTPDGSDLDTGVDLGSGSITFLAFAADVGDALNDSVAIALEFIGTMLDFWSYAPVAALLLTITNAGIIIAAFISLLALIIKAANWLINFVIRLLTMFGSFVP